MVADVLASLGPSAVSPTLVEAAGGAPKPAEPATAHPAPPAAALQTGSEKPVRVRPKDQPASAKRQRSARTKHYKYPEDDFFTHSLDETIRYTTKFLHPQLSPNFLTFVGFIVHVLTFVLLEYECFFSTTRTPLHLASPPVCLLPSWFYPTWAASQLIRYIFDVLDGTHARNTGTQSYVRHYFDHVADSICLVLAATVGVTIYPTFIKVPSHYLPTTFTMLSFYTSFVRYFCTGRLRVPYTTHLYNYLNILFFGSITIWAGSASLWNEQYWLKVIYGIANSVITLAVIYYMIQDLFVCVTMTRAGFSGIFRLYRWIIVTSVCIVLNEVFIWQTSGISLLTSSAHPEPLSPFAVTYAENALLGTAWALTDETRLQNNIVYGLFVGILFCGYIDELMSRHLLHRFPATVSPFGVIMILYTAFMQYIRWGDDGLAKAFRISNTEVVLYSTATATIVATVFWLVMMAWDIRSLANEYNTPFRLFINEKKIIKKENPVA